MGGRTYVVRRISDRAEMASYNRNREKTSSSKLFGRYRAWDLGPFPINRLTLGEGTPGVYIYI